MTNDNRMCTEHYNIIIIRICASKYNELQAERRADEGRKVPLCRESPSTSNDQAILRTSAVAAASFS